MIRSAAAALMVFGLTATGAGAQSLEKIEAGKKVYAAQKCQTCHAVQGVGNKKGPLDDVAARLSGEEIRSWIVSAPEMTAKTKAARKPLMKSYTLAKDDLDALVTYLLSLKPKS
jgi:mono/diheme cytochrome c family protein